MHVSQHTHERGDPYAGGDEHQLVVIGVKNVGESAEWSVDGC